jgi:hypothetical protein
MAPAVSERKDFTCGRDGLVFRTALIAAWELEHAE